MNAKISAFTSTSNSGGAILVKSPDVRVIAKHFDNASDGGWSGTGSSQNDGGGRDDNGNGMISVQAFFKSLQQQAYRSTSYYFC